MSYFLRFIWKRTSLASSEAIIEWTVGSNTVPGTYRIRHFGYYKYVFGGIFAYEGITNDFQVE